MSVQCKNCLNGKREGTQIKCIAWKNGGYVNAKKQRLCPRYIKQGKEELKQWNI